MKPILTALMACLLAGVTPAQNVLPLSDSFLARADAYEVTVKGKGQLMPVTFGDYRPVQSWEKQAATSEGWLDLKDLSWVREQKDVRYGYSFIFTHPDGDSALVACRFKPGGTISIVNGAEVRDIFSAVIRTNRDAGHWDMMIEHGVSGAGFTKGLKGGRLTNGKESYRVEVHRSWKSGKKPLVGPAGFEFFRGETPVAAVQFGGFNKARVWITREEDAATRFLLASAAEALLMWGANGGYEEETR